MFIIKRNENDFQFEGPNLEYKHKLIQNTQNKMSRRMEEQNVPVSGEVYSAVDKASICCVGISTLFAIGFTAISWFTLWVSLGNETATENLIIFTVFMGVLCPFCAVAGLFSLCRSWAHMAMVFVVLTTVIGIIVFAITVADWVSPECKDNIIQIRPCKDGVKQKPLTTVGFGVLIWSLLLIAGIAGCRVQRLMRHKKYSKIMAGKEKQRPLVHPESEEDGIHQE